MKQRIWMLVAALALCLWLCPTGAFAADKDRKSVV